MAHKIYNAGARAFEKQLINNLRKSLKNHLCTKHAYLQYYEVSIILQYYDKVIDPENILLIYQNPLEDILQHLITGNIAVLANKSSTVLTKKPKK